MIGLFPAVLLTQHRKVFTYKNFYFAILLALVLISPNLIWQFNNYFPVFRHLKELAETQLVHVDRMDFLKGQLFFFIGSSVVIISALYALLVYPTFKKYRLFFWSIIFTLFVFTYFKAKDYYAIGLYPIYISFGSAFLEVILKDGWKKYLQAIVLIIPVLLFIPMYTIDFPNKTPEDIVQHQERYKAMGMLRWEDGEDHELPQDFADMLGWKALAQKIDSIYAQLPNPDQTIIICDNYGQAGAINYYATNKKMVAVSFNADYINWFRLDKKITDVILVKEPEDEDKSRKKEAPFFDTVYLAGTRVHLFAREPEISIYLLKGAKINVNKYIETKIKEKKNE
jgi:hypothetical protein